ncbi:MAG: stage II sporulation protein M [Anaerolineae bacterium]|nr:stage II sporulation protein M [Gloeobacterales cyanobacterium ES-bin-313]
MNIQRWIARREQNWKDLEKLLSQAEKKGLPSLSATEVREMSSLYRSVSADLARGRTFAVGNTLLADLQTLTARGYAQIYQGSRGQEWRQAIAFYRWKLPETIRQTWIYTAIATGLFVLGGLFGWWYGWHDPNFIQTVAGSELISKVRDRHELWMGSIVGIEPLASSGIIINNLSVSFAAVAGGMTAGLVTGFMMLSNGVNVGTLAVLVSQNNLATPFWAFIFPHGALELPAIFFAGAAGLLLARALLFPGRYSRKEALRLYGGQAAQLVLAVIPMLIVAGTIEGFFSPNPNIPDSLKFFAGLVNFILLIAYCRSRKPQLART